MSSNRPFTPGPEELSAIRAEAMEFAGIGIYRYRPDGTILFMDVGTLRLLDLQDQVEEPAELVGRDISSLFEYQEPQHSLRDEVMQRGQVRRFEYGYRTLSGEERWVNHDAFLVRDPKTGETAIQVICFDISERKRSASALRRSEDRTRALLAAIPDMMFRLTRDGTFTEFFTHHTEDLYVPPEQIVGSNIRDLFPPQMAEQSLACVQQALATGEPVAHEYSLEMDDETRHFEARHVKANDDECVAIVRDMTELKQAHEEKLRLEVAIQQAQKLDSLGLMAGGIAHDFNNLLTGILGETDLLMASLDMGSPRFERVERIQRTARRAADLTTALLAYTGRTNLERRVVDLSELAGDMTRLFETVIGHRAQLRFQLPEEAIRVEADPTQLRQVVMNLITNAVDACAGTTDPLVVLATGIAEVDEVALADAHGADNLLPGEYAFVEVRDSGRGMDADDVRKVFDPFFTTKSSGRGLGLATVLGIVRAHEGAVVVRTFPGRGATFRVLLPITDRPVTPAEDPSMSLRTPAGVVGTTLLVVDDEEAVRAVTRGVLEREGAMVLEAEDGPVAIQLLAADPRAVDMVLLDVTMPGMSGYETLEALRSLREDLPVMMMSGYMEPGVSLEARGLDEVRFLHKPFRVEQLLDEVCKTLRRR